MSSRGLYRQAVNEVGRQERVQRVGGLGVKVGNLRGCMSAARNDSLRPVMYYLGRQKTREWPLLYSANLRLPRLTEHPARAQRSGQSEGGT